MTAVYNAYMSYTMCKAFEFLMSDECISYRHYQNYKKRVAGTFREFIHNLCKQLRAEFSVPGTPIGNPINIPFDIFASESFDASSFTEMNPLSTEAAVNLNKKCYNKREFFFSDPNLVALRTTQRSTHKSVPSKDSDGNKLRLRCIWCCENHTSTKILQKNDCNGRTGYKTSHMCVMCKVPLCNTARYNGKTCHDIFHAAKRINNPCARSSMTGLNVPVRRRDSLTSSIAASAASMNCDDEPMGEDDCGNDDSENLVNGRARKKRRLSDHIVLQDPSFATRSTKKK